MGDSSAGSPTPWQRILMDQGGGKLARPRRPPPFLHTSVSSADEDIHILTEGLRKRAAAAHLQATSKAGLQKSWAAFIHQYEASCELPMAGSTDIVPALGQLTDDPAGSRTE